MEELVVHVTQDLGKQSIAVSEVAIDQSDRRVGTSRDVGDAKAQNAISLNFSSRTVENALAGVGNGWRN
jgi:hypothetical protein